MTLVTRDFTQANSSTIANSTELGGTGDWEVISNKLRCNSLGGGLGYYWREDSDVGSSDMFAQCLVTSVQASANSNTGVMLRAQTGATNTSYQVTGRHAGDIIWVWRISAGSESQLSWQTGQTGLSVTWASGDVIRGEVFGSLIRAKINGVLVGLCVDTNIASGSRGGVNGWNETTPDFVEVDDWAAGALIADGGLAAGFVSGIGAQTARSTSASMTPTIPASVAAGQLVIAQGTVRSVTDTISPPAGEGWSQLELASGNSLRTYVWAKVWGLGGQTDDTTPTFTRTGTTGAFVTCSLLTNPLHSTRPWTSVASAIAGSGNQSNAAAAACTAPSVSGNWSNATVVRLFSSADDNALNTPSAGTVLVYGTATYDATDIAQAMTVAEDITVTTNTGTATVQETVLGNDANNGVTLVVVIPPLAAVAALAETDALLAVSRSSSKDAAPITVAHALLGVARTGAQTVSALTELDVLQPVAHTHAPLITTLVETDVLAGVQRAASTQLAGLAETDLLIAASATHARTVSALAELNALFAPSQASNRPAGVLTEADVLLGVARSTSTLLGPLSEADVLLAGLRTGSQVAGGLSELDELLALAPAALVGSLAESDQLMAVGHVTERPVLVLTEINGLLAVEHASARDVVTLAEVDALLGAQRTGEQAVGLLAELDALLAPIVVVTDVQVTVEDLQRRYAVGDLVRGKRVVGDLGHRVRPGELTQHRVRGDLKRKYDVGDLEAEL